MKKTIFASACVLLALTMLVRISSSATYDPWVDLDDNGAINIFDVVTLAGSYQTTGDPTKNVNVVNWPVTNQQTVWYMQTVDTTSAMYNASGFGHLHLIWVVTGLTGAESVTVKTWVRISSPTGGGSADFVAQSSVITSASDKGALSAPVPAEAFYFALDIADGTTATVYFAFYLTYA